MFMFPNINPVAFALGPIKVHWYGLMYLIGLLSFMARQALSSILDQTTNRRSNFLCGIGHNYWRQTRLHDTLRCT